MNKWQALHAFWSSFEWDAYDASSVPDYAISTAEHYITYEAADAEFGSPIMLGASLWMKSHQWETISLKSKEIYDAIGWEGSRFPVDGGCIWIKRGTPFATRLADENDDIRRIFINIEVDFLTA